MLSNQLKSITDLRFNPLAVVQSAKDEGPIFILNRNKPVGVILNVSDYEALVDKLQDALDVVEIKEKKKTSKISDFVTHEQLFSRLGMSENV